MEITQTYKVFIALLVIGTAAIAGCTSATQKNAVAVFTTNHGTFEVELFEDKMPITTGNFKKLASEGFYDNTTFHRVIDGFMIQGGDPKGDGTGGPGYTIKDEFSLGLSNVVGTIAMANRGPNTGGSQFFINVADNTRLDPKHPVFGKVISGMDVVLEISKVEKNRMDRPITPVVVESIVIK